MANLEQLPNEMLANIILQLPAYQIYYLSRVSKFWKRLIEGTPSIRAAQAMASQNRTLHGFQIPAYEIDFGTPRQSTELMRFYPALVARDTFVGERKCWRYKTVLIDKHDITTLTPRRAEYATFPRLKCLLMQIDRDKRVNIMIQKEEGIKIDDIIDARQTLNEIYYDTRPAYTSRQRSEDLVAQSNGTFAMELTVKILVGESFPYMMRRTQT